MDPEAKDRVDIAWQRYRRAKAELDMAREQLAREVAAAAAAGAKKAEIARLLGVTRQAVQELFRGERKT